MPHHLDDERSETGSNKRRRVEVKMEDSNNHRSPSPSSSTFSFSDDESTDRAPAQEESSTDRSHLLEAESIDRNRVLGDESTDMSPALGDEPALGNSELRPFIPQAQPQSQLSQQHTPRTPLFAPDSRTKGLRKPESTNPADFWYISQQRWDSFVAETAIPDDVAVALNRLKTFDQAGRVMETSEGAIAAVPCHTCQKAGNVCKMFANGKYVTCAYCKRIAKGGCTASLTLRTGASAMEGSQVPGKRGRPRKHASPPVEYKPAMQRRDGGDSDSRLARLEEELAATKRRLDDVERTSQQRLEILERELAATRSRLSNGNGQMGQQQHASSALYAELRALCDKYKDVS
ncbi:hypothetical protein LTR09_009632 [Extremus antarcticus]|uniref:Uncharacterized protein n=1 Tax=Extremus antarcticus TaxID=702011 RepID=A0AAJ0G609_9PEZI|nr:hypothetical protein LTR09_009632 [Extremus antarcticus]